MKRHRFSLVLASCPRGARTDPDVVVVASAAEAEHLCTRAVRPAPTRHFVQTRERAKRPNTDGRGGPSFVRDAGTRYLQG